MIGRTVVRQYTKSARESTYVEFRRLSRTMASLAESDALSCKINGIFIINIYSTSFWMNPRLIQHLSKQFDVFIKLIYRTDRHQCFTRRQLRANECYPTLGHDSSNGQDLGRSDWPSGTDEDIMQVQTLYMQQSCTETYFWRKWS